jgi:hypothetical protein
MKVTERIATNACNVYLKEMQQGKPMRCAQPQKIAQKMYSYLNVKCNFDESSVWIDSVSQLKLF